MRKNVLFIISASILLAIILFGFYYLRNQKEFSSDTLDAVPISSECVMKFSSLSKFEELLGDSRGIIKDINKFKAAKEVKELIDSLFSKLESKASFSDINTKKSFTCATKLTGKSNVELLYIFPLSNYNELRAIESFVRDRFNDYSVRTRKYSGQEIKSYTKGKKEYNASFVDGLLLISESTILIEDAIRQIDTSPKLRDIADFSKVYKTAGSNADVNIFVNNANVSKLIKLISSKENSRLVSSLSGLASWTSLDIDVDTKYIQLNGFTKTAEKRFDMFDIFVGQEPVESQLINVIPANVATFSLMSLSDVNKYREDNAKYLNQAGKLRNYRKDISRINKLYGYDLEDIFFSFFDGEAANVSMAVNTLDIHKNKLAIFKTKGTSLVKDNMMKLLNHYARNNKKPLSYYTGKVVLDSEKSFNIYKLAVKDIPYRLFGNMFLNVPGEYFMVIDNYLVFGGSKKALSDFAHSYVLNKNIQSDVIYKECKQLFTSKGNFKFYSNTSSSIPLLNSFFDSKTRKIIDENKEKISKFYSVCYQFSSVNDMIYNNLFFMYSETLKERPLTIWESGLDAGVKMKPVIVMNHKTKEKEIVVQDEQNNMYLINSTGRVLWKLPLDGKITSEIVQVDKYRNNKLQYLFSTKNKIFLIDRNGNHVGRFPIMLKSSSDKGISVFDYDLNRKYRIFVPCDNQKVYLYDMEGNIVKGWKFNKTENKIVTEVNHFRIGNKDYIVFADEYKVYLLDRKGEIRSKTERYFNVSANAQFVLAEENNPQRAHLLVTDTKGIVHKINFNGKISKLNSFGQFSPQHRFTAEDIDGDKKLEYIYSDGNKLMVFGTKKKVFDFEVDGYLEGVPNIFSFGWNNKKIGILDGKNNLIYLINNDGDVYTGFPVQGKSPFSISFMKGKNRGFNMFVGSSGASLFNYKVKL